MPVQPSNTDPSTRRKPGRLVRIKQLLPQPPSKGAPLQEQIEYIKKLPAFLAQIADNQDDLSRMLWFQQSSLPGKHGLTHMGGDDSIAGTGIVQPVGPPGTPGTRGDPHLGFSPHNHIHALNLGGLEDLLEIDIDLFGALVSDSKLQDVLAEIAIQLQEIAQLILEQTGATADASAAGDEAMVLALMGM